jgi:hypothetical protein
VTEPYTREDAREDRAEALGWLTAVLTYEATDPALRQLLDGAMERTPPDRLVYAMGWVALRLAALSAEVLGYDDVRPLVQIVAAMNHHGPDS